MWMVLMMMLRQVSGAPDCSAVSASRIHVSLWEGGGGGGEAMVVVRGVIEMEEKGWLCACVRIA